MTLYTVKKPAAHNRVANAIIATVMLAAIAGAFAAETSFGTFTDTRRTRRL
jgi:hypothetical protein